MNGTERKKYLMTYTEAEKLTDSGKLADYFRKNKKYHRIMTLLLENYKKFGQVKGNIILNDASMEECDAINALISPKNSFLPPVLIFRMSDFEKGIRKTVYSQADLTDVLRIYFKSDIISNKDRKIIFLEEKNNFFQKLINRYSDTPCSKWLKALSENYKHGYKTFMNEYNESHEKAEHIIHNVCKAVNLRTKKNTEPVLLAVMSADITGDPHSFDKDTSTGKLFIHALAFLSGISDYKSSEEIRYIYSLYLVEPDSISGAAAAIGIRLYHEDKSEHSAYKAFADIKEIAMISTANLQNIKYASANNRTVFVVENPMVFSALKDIASERDLSLLCTFGQIKSSGLRLLDMLINNNCDIYYAGDLDPEGVQIADNLYCRYSSEKFHIWRMSENEYNSIQKSSDTLPEYRLKKIYNTNSPDLKNVSECILKNKRAAYQELLIASMREDLKSFGLII